MAKDKYFNIILKKLLRKIVIYIVILIIFALLIDSNFFKFNKDIHNFLSVRLDAILLVFIIGGILVIIIREFLRLENDYIYVCSSIDNLDDEIIDLPLEFKSLEDRLNKQKLIQKEMKYSIKEHENRDNELITYLAHDLRTPLTSIIGYLSMIDEMKDLPSKQRERYIRQVLDKSLELEELINQFFEITRLNNGEITLHKEKIDLEYFLLQLKDELYPMAKQNDNKIKIYSDGPVFVNIDPDRMKRVFENILKNALLYSYPDTEIRINISQTYKNAVIEIINETDTLEEAQIRNMFNKFTRLNSSRNSGKVGSGLGLPISKEIVDLHNGNIEVKSANNEVVFIISLIK